MQTLTADIFVDNTHLELSLWDTAGQEEFDRLRSLSYDDTHAIMLCFSVSSHHRLSHIRSDTLKVDSPDSLENVESKWMGEISEHCPGVDIVLVALKCDLRPGGDDDPIEGAEPKQTGITYDQGLEVAKRIHALRYLGTDICQHSCSMTSIEQLTITQNAPP